MTRHIVICRNDDWELSYKTVKQFLDAEIIWEDEDANERDPNNRYYGITGDSESIEEEININLVAINALPVMDH